MNAINRKDGVLSKLLNYRFSEGELSGVHVGNLIVAALSRIQGSYLEGIHALNVLLNLPARILPVSNHSTQICAQLEDGTRLVGERQIIKREKAKVPVQSYFLQDQVPAVAEGITAIKEADMIIICPGVIGTGIVSTLLFEGMREALCNSAAKLVYFCNVMTYPSQSDKFNVSDHLALLEQYTGRPIDYVVVNSRTPNQEILQHYRTR
ncbi:MAG: YvcK family protein [Candidatus Peribacteria bacterium]|nr:MAG: YvcK family protein [Candidatus Peribacteria bacterium]